MIDFLLCLPSKFGLFLFVPNERDDVKHYFTI
jgi:hypothetical protein